MDRISREKQLKRRIGIGAAVVVAVPLIILACVLFKGGSTNKEAVYKPGVYTETGYESAAVGYRFVAPEGCILSTEEQLVELMGTSYELLKSEYDEMDLYYTQQATVYDMMASMPSGVNVNVIWARTEGSIKEEDIVESVKKELEALEFMNVSVQEGYDKAKIAGREYIKMVSTAEMQGVKMIQEYYVDAQKGYSVSMTVTYYEGYEAERDALINAFEEK